MTYYIIYDSRKDNFKPIGIVKCDDITRDFYDKTEHKAIYLGTDGRGITYSSLDFFTDSVAMSKASNEILHFLKKKGIANEF